MVLSDCLCLCAKMSSLRLQPHEQLVWQPFSDIQRVRIRAMCGTGLGDWVSVHALKWLMFYWMHCMFHWMLCVPLGVLYAPLDAHTVCSTGWTLCSTWCTMHSTGRERCSSQMSCILQLCCYRHVDSMPVTISVDAHGVGFEDVSIEHVLLDMLHFYHRHTSPPEEMRV